MTERYRNYGPTDQADLDAATSGLEMRTESDARLQQIVRLHKNIDHVASVVITMAAYREMDNRRRERSDNLA
jgi:hypothetical protein